MMLLNVMISLLQWTSAVIERAKQLGIRVKFLPANSTSHLQPMDCSLNASFKIKIKDQWKKWFFQQTRSGEAAKTRYGNWKMADKNTFNRWVMTAWLAIKQESGVKSFNHTLTGLPQLEAAIKHLEGKPEVVIPPAYNRRAKKNDVDLNVQDSEQEQDAEHLYDSTESLNVAEFEAEIEDESEAEYEVNEFDEAMSSGDELMMDIVQRQLQQSPDTIIETSQTEIKKRKESCTSSAQSTKRIRK